MTPSTTETAAAGPRATPTRAWWSPPVGETAATLEAAEFTAYEAALAVRLERQIRLGRFNIPQVPQAAVEAMALLANPEADARDAADLIERDQKLAADLLHAANSAMSGGGAPATNVPAALMRVGFRRTRGLIFAASLRAAVYAGAELARAERLWRHACACAAASARVAENTGYDPDDLHLAGLFHDVGKIVALSLVDAVSLRSQHDALRPEFIHAVILRHASAVGAETAMHWGLPDDVVDVVLCHDESESSTLTAPQAIVAVADVACRRLGVAAGDEDLDDGRPIAGPAALRALRRTASEVGCVVAGVPEAVSDMLARC